MRKGENWIEGGMMSCLAFEATQDFFEGSSCGFRGWVGSEHHAFYYDVLLKR